MQDVWLSPEIFRPVVDPDQSEVATGGEIAARMGRALNNKARAEDDMGQLLFRCPKTGRDFDSGFQAGSSEMNLVPAGAKFKVRCEICGNLHEFRFSDAKVREKANPRRR